MTMAHRRYNEELEYVILCHAQEKLARLKNHLYQIILCHHLEGIHSV